MSERNLIPDTNPFPEFRLFQPLETIKKIGHFLFDHITSAPDFTSDHYRGGAATLDRELYDIPESTRALLDYSTLEE